MQEIAYAASGEAGLRSSVVAALGKQDELQATLAVMTHIKVTLESSGSNTPAAEIKEFLSAAQSRKSIM
jgi:hypothetical protein